MTYMYKMYDCFKKIRWLLIIFCKRLQNLDFLNILYIIWFENNMFI